MGWQFRQGHAITVPDGLSEDRGQEGAQRQLSNLTGAVLALGRLALRRNPSCL